MPRCLNCKKEIIHLFLYQQVVEKRWFTLDKNGDGNAETVETEDIDNEWYECPECNVGLFHDWEEAEKFLQGEED